MSKIPKARPPTLGYETPDSKEFTQMGYGSYLSCTSQKREPYCISFLQTIGRLKEADHLVITREKLDLPSNSGYYLIGRFYQRTK